MKNNNNFNDFKKARQVIPTKKTHFVNSIIYKQIAGQINQGISKIKNHKDSKDTLLIKEKSKKQQEKNMPSKKNSFNQFNKKGSRMDISGLDMHQVYHKLTDNFLVDKPQQNKMQFEDTKHLASKQKRQTRQSTNSSEYVKKSNKFVKLITQNLQNIRVQKNMFNYQYIIGKGGFGKVWKVEHKKSKNQYAMKQMLKSIVMTKKSVQSVMNERTLLSQFNSPFIVNMHYAFHDRDFLYLVLDYMQGGDLRYHIGNKIFSQIQSKFFIACMVLGLQDLQLNNIIHRDIKPQNLVLDSRGYIRITDLGIARIYKHNNSSDTSGTPGYMSPQVICRMNHSFVSDYFAVGVIAYQLMTGKRPYNGRSRTQIRDLMLAKQVQLKQNQIPDSWSFQAADFINKLIKRKPQNRLGYGGIQELKNHPWLQGINWEKLRSKQLQSPFIPMMKKANFDQDEQITVQDEQQAELIQKNALLLKNESFQQIFQNYYYSINEKEIVDEQKQQKKNVSKRVISAYRNSAQHERQTKISQYVPQKKFSYNQTNQNNRKKIDITAKSTQIQILKQKKKSGQYQRTFFK